jgi:hypothetical protein
MRWRWSDYMQRRAACRNVWQPNGVVSLTQVGRQRSLRSLDGLEFRF